MGEAELFWTKVAALGQVGGAVATLAAVIVSLWIALRGHRPRIRLVVGERLIFGALPEEGLRVLMFSVINAGQRPVHVSGLGWRTGWVRSGPRFLRSQVAVQVTGSIPYGKPPPYELQPGAEQSSYALMESVLDNTRKMSGHPLFARAWPLLGMRRTRIRGYVFTADGYSFLVEAEKTLAIKLAAAEAKKADAE